MDQDSIRAHDLLSTLRSGDTVVLIEHGRASRPMTVDPYGMGMSRSDGAYGSFESCGLTVGYGPGRFNRRVQVDHLAGYGRIKADGKRQVPPTLVLAVAELSRACAGRYDRITELGAWLSERGDLGVVGVTAPSGWTIERAGDDTPAGA